MPQRIGEDVTHLMSDSAKQSQLGEDVTHLMNGTEPVAQSNEPSFLDRLGGWRGVAGGAIRAGSGILAAEGGLPGAAISGLGEGAAELTEGSDLSPTKMGVEAGFGAIPFGKIVKGGKVLGSALRSGAMGAAHSALSDVIGKAQQGATGTDLLPDPTSTALSGGLGALLGAGGAAWAGRGGKGLPPKYPGQAPKIMDEAGTKVYQVPPEAIKTVQAKPNLAPSLQSDYSNTVRTKLGQLLSKAPGASEGLSDLDANIAGVKSAAAKTRTANFRSDLTAGKAETTADLAAIRATIAEQAKAAAQAKITDQIIEHGLVPGEPNVSSTVAPGGKAKLSSRTPYVTPEEDPVEKMLGITRHQQLSGNIPAPALTPDIATPSASSVAPVQTQPKAPVLKAGKVKPSKVEKFQKGISDILGLTEQPKAPEILSEPSATPAAVKQPDLMDEYIKSVEGPVPAFEMGGTRYEPNEIGSHVAVSPATEVQPAQLYKSPVDVAGQNYRAAKADEGGNPLAKRAAGVALNKEAAAAGLPTKGPTDLGKFLTSRVAPELPSLGLAPVEAGASAPAMLNPSGSASKRGGNFLDQLKASVEAQPEAASQVSSPSGEDWVQRELADVAARKAALDPRGEKGAVNPALLKLLSGGTGALVGAPLGAMANPDDPYAALEGAAAGGMLGYAGASGAQEAAQLGKSALGGAGQELINWRNAGLLAGPAQIKKPLSDLAAIIAEGFERSATKGTGRQGMDIFKELARVPTNVSNYAAALKNPELGGEVIGDALRSSAPTSHGALGVIGRPFGAAQYASQQILERAGLSGDEARQILFLSDPKTKLGKWWLSAQDPRVTGPAMSRVVRAVRPFTRIGTNLAERGFERIPGISMFTGDPATRTGRTVLGGLATGLGTLAGADYEASKEAGEETDSPLIRGLKNASFGPYTLPYMAGKALAGPGGMREVYNAIPGLAPLIHPPGPGDTIPSTAGKAIREWLNQMLPDWANPVAISGAEKPIR